MEGEMALPILTQQAAQRIADILTQEADDSVFRVAVNGGGCSGFQYAFEIEAAAQSEDLRLDKDGARVVIDPVSLQYLKGARIDFVDNLMGKSFQIDNPNARSSCGCGVSFSL